VSLRLVRRALHWKSIDELNRELDERIALDDAWRELERKQRALDAERTLDLITGPSFYFGPERPHEDES